MPLSAADPATRNWEAAVGLTSAVSVAVLACVVVAAHIQRADGAARRNRSTVGDIAQHRAMAAQRAIRADIDRATQHGCGRIDIAHLQRACPTCVAPLNAELLPFRISRPDPCLANVPEPARLPLKVPLAFDSVSVCLACADRAVARKIRNRGAIARAGDIQGAVVDHPARTRDAARTRQC